MASQDGVVIADGDVEAPNLHILLRPEIIEEFPFYGRKKAVIDEKSCTSCGLCYELCRFGAVRRDGVHRIDYLRCEGCGLCYRACPVEAIEMKAVKAGKVFVSHTRYGTMVHAMLKPGEENSGRLVHEVREKAKKIGEREGVEFIILDAPPGIGCPVMASLTGADLALIVTEPTFSGLRDMQRVIELAEHFEVKCAVAINKYDVNLKVTEKIRKFCVEKDVEVVGEISYNQEIPVLLSQMRIPVEFVPLDMWSRLREILKS